MMNKKEKNIEILWQYKVMEYLSCFLVFVVPIYFNFQHWFPFGSPKAIIIIGGILFTVMFYLWGKLVEENWSFRFTPLHIILLIFILILTISSIFGIDPHNSFFGTWSQNISLILIYSLTAFSLIIGFLVKKNKKFLSHILLSSFFGSIIVAFLLYSGNSLFNSLKEGGTIGNSSYAGSYLLFNVCFGIGLFFYYKKYWQKICLILGSLFIAFSPVFFNKDIFLNKVSIIEAIKDPLLFFGTANAAMFGLFISISTIIFLFFINSSKKFLKISGLILLVSLFLSTWVIGLNLMNPSSQLHQIYIEEKTENRLIAWDIAKTSFMEHPFLGSGFNNYLYSYQKYFNPDIFKKENAPEIYFAQPHNTFWEYASNNGILGLSSYLLVLIFVFFALYYKKENEERRYLNFKLTLTSILFGYFVQNLFGFDTPVTYLMFFLIIGFAIGESHKEWIIKISNKFNFFYKFFLVLLIFSSFYLFYMFAILPWKESKVFRKMASTDNIKELTFLRKGVQDISLLGGAYDTAFLNQKFFDLYQKNLDKINQTNIEFFIEEIDSIIKQSEVEINRQPYDIRSHIVISDFLNLHLIVISKIDEDIWNKSYKNVQKALELNSQNPQIYLLLARTYALKNDFKNAYIAIHQAIELAPSYSKSYEYAHILLKINPDKDFQKFVDEMEKKWIIKN